MLTTLGMILLGFAGFSAAFILFVFLFGNKGIFINLSSTSATAIPGTPLDIFPTASLTPTANATVLDLELTTMGMIFMYGGMIATLLLAVMMFLSPWSILNKCRVCAACACPEPACPTGCAA